MGEIMSDIIVQEFNVGTKIKPAIVKCVSLFVAMGCTENKTNGSYKIKYSDYWVTEQGGIVSTKRAAPKELSPTRRCSAYTEFKLSSKMHGDFTILTNKDVIARVHKALGQAVAGKKTAAVITSTKASAVATSIKSNKMTSNLPVSAALASRKGFIIGTISPDGKFGISADPAIHQTIELAKIEAARLADQVSDKFEKGTVFIVLSMVGGFLKQDVVEF